MVSAIQIFDSFYLVLYPSFIPSGEHPPALPAEFMLTEYYSRDLLEIHSNRHVQVPPTGPAWKSQVVRQVRPQRGVRCIKQFLWMDKAKLSY